MADTLNNKIEVAWMELRKAQPEGGEARRTYRTRMTYVIADQLNTTPERVRQRMTKIERRETGAPHCPTCTCERVEE